MKSNCEACGQPVGTHGKRFCSRACANRRQQPKKLKTCETCGTVFGQRPRRDKAGNPRESRFCSLGCYLKAVKPEPRHCAHCGSEIPQTGWAYEAKYCSRSCYFAAMEHSGAWKGGRNIDADGYVRVWAPWSLEGRADGYALEHRLVMADAVGRPLADEEVVHHVNGDKADNRLENLMLFVNQSEHRRFHASPTRSQEEVPNGS